MSDSMLSEDISQHIPWPKWSKDRIAEHMAEIERLRELLDWIKKRATVLPYEEDDIDQLKLNLSKIRFWAECALETEEKAHDEE